MRTFKTTKRALAVAGLVGVALLFTGCPSTGYPYPDPNPNPNPNPNPGGDPVALYDQGFDAGFAKDDWYWDGYYDGYDTLGFEPIYYDVSGIPDLESPAYDAGYWDGVWWAYNDGYFVNYRYAFIIGFSEGYDNAFWDDYLEFLQSDQHFELLNGGWDDGYNDGFSEGRIFGAADYEAGLPLDWVTALRDYEAGEDLYFEEINLGTGIYGPVYLYEYGVDPNFLKSAKDNLRLRDNVDMTMRTIRRDNLEKAANDDAKQLDDLYRPIRAQARQDLEVSPGTSLRNSRELRVDGTWYDRVLAYTLVGSKVRTESDTPRPRAVQP